MKPGPPGPGGALPRPKRWYAKAWDRVVECFGGSVAEASPLPIIHYYHGDHLGSTNLVTDGTGAVVEHTEYTPYGSVHLNTGSVDVAHKFTGQRQDATNGLILFPARAYDPQLGRFLQPDPFIQDQSDPQTLNRYSYVRNNPLRYVDPSGYSWFSHLLHALFFAALSFLFFAAAGASFFEGQVFLGVAFTAGGMWAANQSAANFRAAFASGTNSRGPPGLTPGGDSFLEQLGPTLFQTGSSQSRAPPVPVLGGVAAGALADTPLGELVLAGLMAYVAAKYGAPALKQTLDYLVNQPRQDRTIVGYHATDAAGAEGILGQGFDMSRSDLSGENRFGPGFSLGNTERNADLEYMKHHNGQQAPAMLRITARLTKNVPIPHFLAVNQSVSRSIGAVMRFIGGSITYGSFAPGAEGGINYVLFDPQKQVIPPSQRVR